MPSLQESILKKFLQNLEKDGSFDQSKIAKIKALVQQDKKLKPDDLIEVFTLPEGGEIL